MQTKFQFLTISDNLTNQISFPGNVRELRRQNLTYKQNSKMTKDLILAANESKKKPQNLNFDYYTCMYQVYILLLTISLMLMALAPHVCTSLTLSISLPLTCPQSYHKTSSPTIQKPYAQFQIPRATFEIPLVLGDGILKKVCKISEHQHRPMWEKVNSINSATTFCMQHPKQRPQSARSNVPF